jgi:hypothetical protein
MPKLYLIVRFECHNATQPSCRTHDISITGMPIALEDDHTRLLATYTVIDNEAPNGPWTYRVAADIIKMTGRGLHISYGSMSRDGAMERLQKIPEFAKENGEERQKHYQTESDDLLPWEEVETEGNSGPEYTEAEIRWMNKTCVRIKLRSDSYCWYKLVSADVEDMSKYKAVEEKEAEEKEEVEKGGDKKRRKTRAGEALGDDMVS